MGKHYNPGNEAFRRITENGYIDKTGVISIINKDINTTRNLKCISKPRRFGKSFTAQMFIAYYDCSCDSHELFDRYEIKKSSSYEQHINQYNVISWDVTGFISEVKQSDGSLQLSQVPNMISKAVRADLISSYPELENIPSVFDCLLECVKITGRKFVFVIDEWDALIRDTTDAKIQDAYLNLLRGLFKNNDVTPYVVAAAYMTGILPIKKDGSQSAISDFREYSILEPSDFAPYTGFAEKEVKDLCDTYNMSFEEARKWYDGYTVGDAEDIYNPYSIMEAMNRKKYQSYWKKTSAADALSTYINMNYEGLKEDVVRLMTGEEIEVYTDGFQNDFERFSSKDDVLTLMIHLGYLAYDAETGCVRIPNKEVYSEFAGLVKTADTNSLADLIKASEKLLNDTLSGNSDAVTEAIEHIRQSNYAPTFYNNEQALRYVIKFAYIVCVDRYMKVEELPSGIGIADVVYIPKRNKPDPAIVVELKWNKSEGAAISQIKKKKYPAVLEEYGGEIVLVGINYDEKSKNHSCEIERVIK